MKKIFRIISFSITFLISFLMINNVYAATANIKIKTNKTTYIVGDTVTATITLSSSQALGSWDFVVNYDSSYLSFQSSNLEGSDQAVNAIYNDKTYSKSYTMKFKVKKAGSTKLSIKSGGDVYAYNESKMTISSNTVTLKAITKAEYESSLSSVNTLSSLAVAGYDISPKFNKDTTNYSLTLPNDVRSINVSAKVSDSKAKVSGAGTINLNEGVNKVSIVVTAQNGNKKTYVINVTVQELDPVNVTVDGQDYTVVQKKESLPAPNAYEMTTVVIDDKEVPAFHSEITNYTLVGLANKEGDIALYIYDDGNYQLYQETKFGGLTIYAMEPPKDKLITDAKKVDITYNDQVISAYKVDGLIYPLVYALNVETGETNWYSYDSKENTLQRYSLGKGTDIRETIKASVSDKYKNLSILLGTLLGIITFFMLIAMIKLSNRRKQEVVSEINPKW